MELYHKYYHPPPGKQIQYKILINFILELKKMMAKQLSKISIISIIFVKMCSLEWKEIDYSSLDLTKLPVKDSLQ